ncbi:MAG: Wzz/FepE/Etk N-terminal domain-containing protein, partial [Myxococcales bacterium]|nr:Wzz/FepE/Etk N-terminal domain-containing protein [Myxococcales bacterium]
MPGAANEVTPSEQFDLRSRLQVVVRRKWLILLVFAAVVGSVALYSTKQAKVYRAEVTLIIDPREPRFLDSQIQDVNSDTYSSYWANKEYVETQLKVITSRAVSQRVVEKLGLGQDPAFLGVMRIADEEKRAETMKRMDPVAMVRGKIKVEQLKDSRVAFIKIEDLDANRAALLANEVAQAYMDEMLSQRVKVADNAMKWLDERRDSLSDQARTSEMALYTFRKQADMLSTSIDDRASMVSSRLQSTSNALNEVQLRIAGLRARVSAIRSVQADKGADDRLWAEALPAARENVTLGEYKKRLV